MNTFNFNKYIEQVQKYEITNETQVMTMIDKLQERIDRYKVASKNAYNRDDYRYFEKLENEIKAYGNAIDYLLDLDI